MLEAALEKKIPLGILIVLGFLFLILSQTLHWSDSEIWAVSIARVFSLNTEDFASHYKFFFEFLLKQIYLLPLGNAATLDAARLLFAGIGFFILFFIFQITKKLSTSERAPLLAVLTFATTSFFLNQGFRIRSDLLACACQLMGLFFYFRLLQNPSKKEMAGFFLTHLFMLLSTPKAIYLLAMNFVFIAVDLSEQNSALQKKFLKAFAGIAALFAAFVVFRWQQFYSAFVFFKGSFGAQSSHPGYFSIESFFYVSRFIFENPFFISIATLAVFWGWRQRKSFDRRSQALHCSALFGLLVILIHNDRLPFFILSLLPLITISVTILVLDFLSKTVKDPRRAIFIYLVLVTTLAVFHFERSFSKNSNRLQRESMQAMHEYLGRYPDARYFDGAGILPRDNQTYLNIEPTWSGMWPHLEYTLELEQFDLIFLGTRFLHFGDRIFPLLEKNQYIQIGSGVFAKASIIRDATKPELDLHDLCGPLLYDDYSVYVGAQFLQMGLIPNESENLLSQGMPFEIAACSRFAPFVFPKGHHFSQIFDFSLLD